MLNQGSESSPADRLFGSAFPRQDPCLVGVDGDPLYWGSSASPLFCGVSCAYPSARCIECTPYRVCKARIAHALGRGPWASTVMKKWGARMALVDRFCCIAFVARKHRRCGAGPGWRAKAVRHKKKKKTCNNWRRPIHAFRL